MTKKINAEMRGVSFAQNSLPNKQTVIKFEGHQVRIIQLAGEPWFVAADVCKALELPNTTRALAKLDKHENILTLIQGINHGAGNPNVNIISESGFYKLIAYGRKASTKDTQAHRFSNWIFGEVIPSIRKTGNYGVPWAALNDFTKRQANYAIESSKKGAELQACKEEKRQLAEEEANLWRTYQPELSLGGVADNE